MTNQIFELTDADLDSVTGATSLAEAMANMMRWNAAITMAGQGGIEGGSFVPHRPVGPSREFPSYH